MSFLNDFNLFAFAKRTKRPLILDGAMGSLLQQKGVEPHPQLWMSHANTIYPEKVLAVHQEYIDAGADIITTNTFRTNPAASEHEGKNQLKAALNLAKEAVSGKTILIAGSNAPAEDCYERKRTLSLSKLEYNHCKHIDLLIDNGADLILNETQSHMDEINIISRFCADSKIPFIISLFFDDDLKLLSGEDILQVIPLIWEHDPLAIGFNCLMPATFKKLDLAKLKNYRMGFYLNCGDGSYTDTHIKCGINPVQYAEKIKDFYAYNPSFVGACCGSSPEHIAEIKQSFAGRNEN